MNKTNFSNTFIYIFLKIKIKLTIFKKKKKNYLIYYMSTYFICFSSCYRNLFVLSIKIFISNKNHI